ncbi:MAG: hypothetical protein AAFY56_23615, partial [Pseudomonadota bacterium]
MFDAQHDAALDPSGHKVSVEAAPAQPLAVRGAVQYLAPTNERPRILIESNGTRTEEAIAPETHIVEIANARREAEPFTLDGNGFELVAQKSAVTDFFNDQEVKEVFYAEAEALLKKHV